MNFPEPKLGFGLAYFWICVFILITQPFRIAGWLPKIPPWLDDSDQRWLEAEAAVA